MSVAVCHINDEMHQELKAFRFNKSKQARAMILKIDPASKDLIVDGDLLEDVTIDEVKDELPEHQPRFLLYSFPLVHSDSRISYPLCLIFSSPRESKTELMVMYAGSKNELERISNVNKCYELTELDDLTLDWLKAKLAK